MLSEKYKRYGLAILTTVYALNWIDRCLINLLLQPIKMDLDLTDTQLGALTGVAFGVFYALLGLPIARWADRGDRTTITAIAIGLWGGTVMLCVFVTNFVQLLLARVAAAIGESGCMPPTYSLIGDYFPKPAERTRAMSVYWLASPLATLFSFALGGQLNERYGWRWTFFIMGIPALLMVPLVKATLVEPRIQTERQRSRSLPSGGLFAVARTLWGQRSTRHLGIAVVLFFTLGQGLAPWYAAFMIRSHGIQTATLGIWLGLIFGFGGIVGVLLGGHVIGRWFSDDMRGQLRLSAVIVAVLFPFYLLFLLLPGTYTALLALVPLCVVFNFLLGPTFSLLQLLVPAGSRATALAVVMLFANLIGMGVGPQVVGALSDLLARTYGTNSLRYSMLAMSSIALWAGYHFWCSGRTVHDDTAALRAITHVRGNREHILVEPTPDH
jgi:MFS family permease